MYIVVTTPPAQAWRLLLEDLCLNRGCLPHARENLSSTFCQLAIEVPSPPGLDQSAWQGYAADSVINL